jgi:signal transduction histidine kinase
VRTTFAPLPPLGQDLVHALYQGAHEALANVAEHAHATRVDVDLAMDNERPGVAFAQLRITDNGIGFDSDRGGPETDGPDGLRVLDHRLTEMGGSLTVASQPGQGTTVRIELPDTGENRG